MAELFLETSYFWTSETLRNYREHILWVVKDNESLKATVNLIFLFIPLWSVSFVTFPTIAPLCRILITRRKQHTEHGYSFHLYYSICVNSTKRNNFLFRISRYPTYEIPIKLSLISRDLDESHDFPELQSENCLTSNTR